MKKPNPILTGFCMVVAVVTAPLWIPIAMVLMVREYLRQRPIEAKK